MNRIPPLRLRLDPPADGDSREDRASFNESICDFRCDPLDGGRDIEVGRGRDIELHHFGQGANGTPRVGQQE